MPDPDRLGEPVKDTFKIEDKVGHCESDVTAASRDTLERMKQGNEIRMDKSRAASLVATDDEDKMLVTLLKTVLTNCALKIDDATGQLLVDLHDQATAGDQADGQTRLVKSILGTDKETAELKEQLQTCTTERDKLQSSPEDLTRDHNAAKAKNEELTDKLAKLEQNYPDAELPRLLEEMENELAKSRSRERAWQDQLEKKDAYIRSLRSDLDIETRQHKVTRRLRALC